MEYAEFDEIKGEGEEQTFMPNRAYQMFSPKFYKPEKLSRDGASDMEVLIKDEQDNTLYIVSSAFAAGMGGRDGMEEMLLRVNSIHRLSLDEDGSLDYTPLEIANQTIFTASPENILLIDTIVAQPAGAINERAEQFIKKVMEKIT
jgi:hypothetical protein